MKPPNFRKPSELRKKAKKETVSTRINADSKKILDKAAKKNGLSLSELISHVVDDYVTWLKEN